MNILPCMLDVDYTEGMQLTALYEQATRRRCGSEWVAVLRSPTGKMVEHHTLKAAPGDRKAAEAEAAKLVGNA